MHSLQGKPLVIAAFALAGSSVVAAEFVTGVMQPFTIAFFSLFFAVLTAMAVDGAGILRAAAALRAKQWRLLFL